MQNKYRSKSVKKTNLPRLQMHQVDGRKPFPSESREERGASNGTRHTQSMKESIKILSEYIKSRNMKMPNIPYHDNGSRGQTLSVQQPFDYGYALETEKNKTPERQRVQNQSLRKSHNHSYTQDTSKMSKIDAQMEEELDSMREFTLFTNRETKQQLNNEDINREIDRTLGVRKGLRSVKYRNNNFDWKAIESLNGGEALHEIIVNYDNNIEFEAKEDVIEGFSSHIGNSSRPGSSTRPFKETPNDCGRYFNVIFDLEECDALQRHKWEFSSLCINLLRENNDQIQFLIKIIGAERCLLYLYDKNKSELYLKAASCSIREQIAVKLNEEHSGLPAKPFENGNILVVENINPDEIPEDYRRFKKIMPTAPLNAAYFPLKFGEGVVGVLEIINFKDLIDDNLRLITLYCECLAAGLMIYEVKLAQEGKSRAYNMTQFAEAERSLQALMRATGGHAQFKAALFVKNSGTNELNLNCGVNIPQDMKLDPIHISDLNEVTAKIFNDKKVYQTEDFRTEECNQLAGALRSKNSFYFPLLNPQTNLLFFQTPQDPHVVIDEGVVVSEAIRNKIQDQSKIKKLTELADLLDFSMNQSSELVLALSDNHTLVYCNKVTESIFKRRLEDMRGKELTDIFGDSNTIAVSYILSALNSDKDMIYQNLKLQLNWSEYTTSQNNFSSNPSLMPCNIKIIKFNRSNAKCIIIIQPILLFPDPHYQSPRPQQQSTFRTMQNPRQNPYHQALDQMYQEAERDGVPKNRHARDRSTPELGQKPNVNNSFSNYKARPSPHNDSLNMKSLRDSDPFKIQSLSYFDSSANRQNLSNGNSFSAGQYLNDDEYNHESDDYLIDTRNRDTTSASQTNQQSKPNLNPGGDISPYQNGSSSQKLLSAQGQEQNQNDPQTSSFPNVSQQQSNNTHQNQTSDSKSPIQDARGSQDKQGSNNSQSQQASNTKQPSNSNLLNNSNPNNQQSQGNSQQQQQTNYQLKPLSPLTNPTNQGGPPQQPSTNSNQQTINQTRQQMAQQRANATTNNTVNQSQSNQKNSQTSRPTSNSQTQPSKPITQTSNQNNQNSQNVQAQKQQPNVNNSQIDSNSQSLPPTNYYPLTNIPSQKGMTTNQNNISDSSTNIQPSYPNPLPQSNNLQPINPPKQENDVNSLSPIKNQTPVQQPHDIQPLSQGIQKTPGESPVKNDGIPTGINSSSSGIPFTNIHGSQPTPIPSESPLNLSRSDITGGPQQNIQSFQNTQMINSSMNHVSGIQGSGYGNAQAGAGNINEKNQYASMGSTGNVLDSAQFLSKGPISLGQKEPSSQNLGTSAQRYNQQMNSPPINGSSEYPNNSKQNSPILINSNSNIKPQTQQPQMQQTQNQKPAFNQYQKSLEDEAHESGGGGGIIKKRGQ